MKELNSCDVVGVGDTFTLVDDNRLFVATSKNEKSSGCVGCVGEEGSNRKCFDLPLCGYDTHSVMFKEAED